MAIHPVGYDDANPNKPVAGYSGGGGWVDEDFTVSSSPQTVFTTTHAFTTTQKIDVLVDGRLQQNYTRTVGNTITLSEGVQVGSWVRIRIYSF